MSVRLLSLFPIIALFVSACTPVGVVTGGAAATGVAAAKEGGLSQTASDIRIQAEINDLWLQYDIETYGKLDMTVNQGRVLLTGVLQDPQKRVEAVRLAWQPKGVKQVINEIEIADSGGITGFLTDSLISSKIRGALIVDKDVQSINYNIDTVNKTVYLLGVAQSQYELNRVISIARATSSVKRVVSYVKMVGEPVGDFDAAGQNTTPQTAPQPAPQYQAPQPAYQDQPYQSPQPEIQWESERTGQPRNIVPQADPNISSEIPANPYNQNYNASGSITREPI